MFAKLCPFFGAGSFDEDCVLEVAGTWSSLANLSSDEGVTVSFVLCLGDGGVISSFESIFDCFLTFVMVLSSILSSSLGLSSGGLFLK